jgi:uncharacterized SAM-binding protein YcdF (DUF218 family)
VDLDLLLRVFAKSIVLPPTGPLLVALLGLVLLRARPRLGAALAWTGTLALLLLSTPAVAVWLLRPFDLPQFDPARAAEAQAIVILGGGMRSAREYGGDTLGRLTLERVRYGAKVARETGLPVLVTGGRPPWSDRSEAQAMREALVDEYGVPVRWVEARARNTHENARFSASLVRASGVHTVVLVAHTFDMPRARAEFADAGLATIPAATGLAVPEEIDARYFMPSAGALQASYYALYEALANAARAVGF